jgi:hypothetical protein
MRRQPPFQVGFLILLLLGTPWARGDDRVPTAAEKALEDAFSLYCEALEGVDKQCSGEISLARKYLTLAAVCGATSPEIHCQEFHDAGTSAEGHEKLAPLVLALDHRTGRWHLRHRLQGADEHRVEFSVAGEPTVSLAGNERIVVIVENTNPLLYSMVAAKPSEEDVPELSSIKKLLTTLGGGIASYLKVVGDSAVAGAASGDPLGDYTKELVVFVEGLEVPLSMVECRVGEVAVQTSRAIAFIQAVELGQDGTYHLEPPSPPQCVAGGSHTQLPKTEAVAAAFDMVQLLLFSPRHRPETCAARLEAAHTVVTADPADQAKVRAATSAFEKTLPCGVELLDEALEKMVAEVEEPLNEAEAAMVEVRAHATELKELEDLKTPTAAQKERLRVLREEKAAGSLVQEKFLEAMRLALSDERAYAGRLLEAAKLARMVVDIRKEAEGIVAKRDDVLKATAQLEVFERRLLRHQLYTFQCPDPQDGSQVVKRCVKPGHLDDRLILEPQLKDVRVTKIQKHAVTVKPDSLYAAKVVATRPAEVTAAYSLDSALRGLWGISASVVYTGLSSPTFGAVTSEDDPMRKVIAITDETSRAGELALLADFRLGRWLACRSTYDNCRSRSQLFGVELGAGLGDDPAFLAGISLRPSRSWRLGFGYTYQQVKELRGQVLSQEVASGDDIRTRDHFEGDWYISLSFALESMTLFASGD